MEFVEGKELQDYLDDLGKPIDEDLSVAFMRQILSAFSHAHNKGIVHRDIKCANVFLCSDGGVKLGDMNVSKIAKQGIMQTQTGTPYYCPPEVWADKPYSSKCDLWSLGCVIYELTALKPPFLARNMNELYSKVTKGKYPAIPTHYSKELAQMIGYRVQPIAKTVDVLESLDVLAVTLLVGGREFAALGRGQFFDLAQHIRSRFVLASNVARRNPAIQHLVQLIGIRIHENRLPGTTGRQGRQRGLGRHVLNRVHADAKMRQQCLGQYLADFIVDGRSTRWHTITTAVATQGTKESTVRGTGMRTVQTVNDVQPVLKRFQCLNRLG